MNSLDKNLWKATLFCCLLTLFTACGDSKDDDKEEGTNPVTNNNSNTDNFESKLLECNLPAGETLTLTNRNDHIDYIVDCKYNIKGHLNIEKDVTIQFQTDAGFAIYDKGYLKAIGTKNAPVLFTGVDKTEGSWRGVFFNSNHVNNELSYTTIEYAGGEAFNSNGDKGSIIVYAGARLKANNNTLRHGEMYGVTMNYGEAEVQLHNNEINTHKAPLHIQGQYVDKVVGGKYVNNSTNAILINNYTSTISDNCRWRELGVPYHILDRMVVVAGGNMVVDAGVTMAFAGDVQLVIDEGASGSKPSLVAVGKEVDSDSIAKPITFTGINKIQGAWKGIYFDSPNPLNQIAFAKIEYASNPAQEGAIEVWAGTVLSVHDVEFKEIQNCAIHGGHKGYLNAVTTSNLIYTNTSRGLCEE